MSPVLLTLLWICGAAETYPVSDRTVTDLPLEFRISASPPEGQWRSWTIEDGLEESWSVAISSAPGRTAWVLHGDVDNLSGLDGYSVHKIPNPGILTPLHSGPKGQQWSVYFKPPEQSIGFDFWDGTAWSRHPCPELLVGMKAYEEGRIEFGVASLKWYFAALVPDRILFCTGAELMEYDAESRQTRILKRASETGLKRFASLQAARDGGLWIGGRRGIAKWSPSEEGLTADSPWREYLTDPDAPLEEFYFIQEDPDGEVSALARSTTHPKERLLVRLNEQEWSVLYRGSDFSLAWKSPDDRVWVLRSADPTHLNRDTWKLSCLHNQTEETVQQEGVLSGGLHHVAVDSGGVFWILTSLGVVRYAPSAWERPSFFPPSDKTESCLYHEKSGQMVLARADTLAVWDRDRWSTVNWLEQSAYNDFYPSRILPLSQNRLLLCVNGITAVFNWDTRQLETLKAPYKTRRAMATLRHNGNLWILFEHKYLCEYDGRDFRLEYEIPPSVQLTTTRDVRSLLETRHGDLWIGDVRQLVRYREGRMDAFGPEQGYTDNAAFSILETREGRLWAGGRSKIHEYDGQRWRVVRDGFDHVISMIQARDGSVWVSSNNGLHRYHEGSWINLTVQDGLPSNQTRYLCEDEQGRIWAATAEGFRVYSPEADADPPIAQLSDIENPKTLAPGGAAQFVYSGRDKWNYTLPPRLLYSHRIGSGAWSAFSSETVANYSHLPPGRHTFEVRSMDRNGNVSQPESWDFSVLLPWYREPKFLIILGVGGTLILLLSGVAWHRHNQFARSFGQLQVTNVRLNEANERLQELDRMKSAFVSQASHDLRTPLTAIKGSLDNLMVGVAGELNDKQKRLMDRAAKSVDRLTALINDVLDLSRIESGRAILEKTPLSTTELVETVLQECRTAAEQKKIALLFASEAKTDTILADPGKMHRVIGELVSNAVKYTPEHGSVRLNLVSNKETVTLSVRDSGIGMTDEECRRIWDRFYRTPASQKMAKGSGLGLSIAKELVELHGGNLTVKSQPGQGATFTLTLPIQKESSTS